MICVGCGCTGSSSAFPRRTGTASRPRDCEPQSSTHASITAHCAPAWPSSHPMLPMQTYLSSDPSAPLKLPSTPGMTKKISQPENLTQITQKSFSQGLYALFQISLEKRGSL